jgi:hypothetical protein
MENWKIISVDALERLAEEKLKPVVAFSLTQQLSFLFTALLDNKNPTGAHIGWLRPEHD